MEVSVDWWPIGAVACLVVLDIVTGIMKGVATKTMSSAKMRDGLMHKSTYFVIIVLFVLVETMQAHFDLWSEFPTTLTVCIYICVTEIVSVIENMVAINPDMGTWPIIKQLIVGDSNADS